MSHRCRLKRGGPPSRVLPVLSIPLLALALSFPGILAAEAAPEAPPEETRADKPSAPEPSSEEKNERLVERVEVTATRAGTDAPVAFTNLGTERIDEEYTTQEMPALLAATPSVNYYSDAGNDIGYSYMFLRGFDQRRIAVTINGTPLNGAENHWVYWVDLPNLADSVQDIQVQRGVGTTYYGSNPIGGTVNLETARPVPGAGWTAEMGAGSYGTSKLAVGWTSPLVAGRWVFAASLSRIASDGYRDDAWTRMGMGFLTAQRLGERSSLRINLYGGEEETHLSFLGLPREELERDRRANPLDWHGEIDHFSQPHLELIHEWRPRDRLEVGNTVYGFTGRGYFDQRIQGGDPFFVGVADPDGTGTWFQRLNIREWDAGWIPRVRWDHGSGTLSAGAELRIHRGHQFGDVRETRGFPDEAPPDFRYYDFRIPKDTWALWVQEDWRPGSRLTVLAGLQTVHHSWQLERDRINGYTYDVTYDWWAPRLGARLSFGPRWSAFASVARSRREPAASDLYDPVWGSVPGFREVDLSPGGRFSDPIPEEEKLTDYEMGASYTSERLHLKATLYDMRFRDEIVYAGGFNTAIGFPFTTNAARSTHRGLELEGTGDLGRGWQMAGSLSLSDDEFDDFVQDFGPGFEVDYSGNRISGFPDRLARLALSWRPAWGRVEIGARHVGRLYVDNSESRDFSIDPYTTAHLDLRWDLPLEGLEGTSVRLRVNNLFDEEYESFGYADCADTDCLTLQPVFLPAAERNVFVMLSWKPSGP